jgi:hypothetical protein
MAANPVSKHRLHVLLAAPAVVLSTLTFASCSDTPATAIVVAISSEANIPKEIDNISIRTSRGGSVTFAQSYAVDHATGTAKLPGTLTFRPLSGEKPEDPIRVEILAQVRGLQVALRTATMPFQEERQKLLRIALRYSCLDTPLLCDQGETCIGGRCQSDAIDVSKLPDFSGADPFPRVGAGECFDPADDACAASRTDIEDLAAFASAGCELDAGGEAGALNVFALWAKSVDQAHPTVLDGHSAEGWSPAPGKPTSFKLAPGLCDAVAAKAIRKVEYNHACPTKTEQLPVCLPATDTPAVSLFAESACHLCVYAPPQCSALLEAAKGDPASKALLACALECPYDGRYDSLDECAAVRGCFFGCLAPYLSCDGTACAPYAALDAWSQCLAGLGPIETRCSAECSPEQASKCQ